MNTTDVASNRTLRLPTAASISRVTPAAVVVPLFTTTLFVSAFLLCLIQPVVAKMVLPLLGGSPMVWNTCMVFFQVALLAGYAYAHGTTKWLNARVQVAAHLGLLLIPLGVLPFIIGRESVTAPESAPITSLLMLLAGAIGLPFFVLATNASVLQHWFSRTDHQSAGDPYFLYVASNVGSFVALAAYPALVEPLLSLRDQSRLWTAGYGLFVVLAAGCSVFAWRARGESPISTHGEADTQPLTARRRAHWALLAFIPSSLMLAVTTYLSTDIAAAPLLWILPLGLYLLTFIAAFSSKAESLQPVVRRAFPLLMIPLALCIGHTGRIAVLVPLHVLTFVAAALLCHTRLAEDRPAPSHLTEFYLWISFGGMLGGLLNGLAAPMLFNSVLEYPLVLGLVCMMLPAQTSDVSPPRALGGDLAAVAIIAALAIGAPRVGTLVGIDTSLVVLALPALVVFKFRRRPLRFALSVGVLLIATLKIGDTSQRVLHAERTFFGVYRVTEDRKSEYRALLHGTTLHGMQAITGAESGEPLTYYHRGGPFGQALAAVSKGRRPEHIAVIGLGVGTLGAYALPGQQWTFYEIDEAVERLARDSRHFNYLRRCGDGCHVVIGDARLSLGRHRGRLYDVLVLDAFSSDSIPLHLLTSEALTVYLEHLHADGLILFHISNRHLNLSTIVGRLAERHTLIALMNFDRKHADWPRSRSESIWVAMSRKRDDLGAIATNPQWQPINIPASTPLWTDDFSNILSALKFH